MTIKDYIESAKTIEEIAEKHLGKYVDFYYIKKKPIVEFITKGLNNPDRDKAFGHDAIEILAEIEYAPTADVEEVQHGEWIDKPTGAYNRMQSWCSACGKHSGIGGIESNRHKPYCPNCGEKMDGERR